MPTDLIDIISSDGIELRRSGPNLIGRCPFHEERTPSFTVWPDHAHCFGCGWHGGAVKYFADSRRVSSEEAKRILSEKGLPVALASPRSAGPVQERQENEKPALPALSPLNQDGINALAKLRCLSPAGIRLAIGSGVLFGCHWPMRHEQHQSWCITDPSRRVAQFRRFDGEPYSLHGRDIKAWTKGRASWPIGAGFIAGAKVILVEGGPDFLSAYHFLSLRFKIGRRWVTPDFSPVTMLGASCKIASDAFPFFDRKRVRILRHNDEAGLHAASIWSEQLATAGAAVETCSLSSLSDARAVRRAFLDFDF